MVLVGAWKGDVDAEVGRRWVGLQRRSSQSQICKRVDGTQRCQRVQMTLMARACQARARGGGSGGQFRTVGSMCRMALVVGVKAPSGIDD